MIVRILLIAPAQPNIDNVPELRSITSMHQVSVLNGNVSAKDIYDYIRSTPTDAEGRKFHVLHFALHSDDVNRQMHLSDGERLDPEDVVQLARLAGADLIFFNTCRSGLFANYATRHGIHYAIYTTEPLPDRDAWKMPIAFYDYLRGQQGTNPDYAAALMVADSGEGIYGFSKALDLTISWHNIIDELRQNQTDIGELRDQMTRLYAFLRVATAVMVASIMLNIFLMVSHL